MEHKPQLRSMREIKLTKVPRSLSSQFKGSRHTFLSLENFLYQTDFRIERRCKVNRERMRMQMGNEGKDYYVRSKGKKDGVLCKPMRKLISYRKLDSLVALCKWKTIIHLDRIWHMYIIRGNTDLIIRCFASFHLFEYPIEMFLL